MGFQHRYGTHHIPWDGDIDPDGSSGPIVAAVLKNLSPREQRNLPEDMQKWLKEQNPCELEVWAPWYRNDDCRPNQRDFNIHENEAFTMYAMECEGDMLTRQGKINKVIKLMVAAGPIMCNDFATQCEIYNQVGIDSDTFTDEEVEYIVGEVAKRL